MRIRRRPPQILAPTSSDPAAVETGFDGASGGESAAVGVENKKAETIVGTEGLHPSIEASGMGGRPSEGDSAVTRRLEQPGGGGRGGIWTSGGSAAGNCYGELERHKGEAEEQGDSKDLKQPLGAAAQLAVATPKTWNHGAHVRGGLQTSSGAAAAAAAAANSLGAQAFVSATATANESRSGVAARKRKNIAWSNGINRSARPPSSSSSAKIEISNEGGVTNSMHGTVDHQLLKDEDHMEGEQQLNHQYQQNLVNGGGNNTGNGGKRRRSPAVLKEGSRCSRVNGRGWRCCQQTLVGYSLCEHHLGKGRLRSVNSVKCKKAGGAAGGKRPPKSLATMALGYDNDDDDYEEEAKRSVGMKRGKRIGTVKARSISSLLGQTSPDVINFAGANLEEVAPMIATARTLAGLSHAVVFSSAIPAEAAVVRIPGESSVPTSATTAAASLPPPTA